METTTRTDPLLTWQWNLYPDGHADRRNLLLHILSVPLFQLGGVLVVLSPFVSWWLLLGALLMPLAMAFQGRGHKLEHVGPVPFSGPLDVVGRIFAEQWITFPRYVLSGAFRRAWRAAAR